MTIQEAIASYFKFDVQLGYRDRFTPVSCPYHKDSNASAGVKFDKDGGVFNCFLCGPRSLKDLATKLELRYDGQFISNDLNWLDDHIAMQSDMPVVKQVKQVELYTKYLEEKGLTDETIKAIGGQYISNPSENLYGYLVFFYDNNTKFCARRILESDKPRFLQSQGEDKGLFGEENINNNDTILLVEGITDYATLYQMGYRNIVASFGAQVSESQAYKFRNKTVFILFDVDYGGYTGSRSLLESLRKFKSTGIILEIPKTFAIEGSKKVEKIDINSAYVKDRAALTDWLNENISKYSTFDSGYVANTFLGTKKITRYFHSSIPGFDKLTNGGYAPGVHLIGGPPGSLKSTLAMQETDHFLEQGARVLVCSFELTKLQYWSRLASRYSMYSWVDIEKDPNILEKEVRKKMLEISNRLKIVVDWGIEEIKHASSLFDVIIPDYIQRMPALGKEEREGIKYNANELSNLVRYENKVILLISSISRAHYNNPCMEAFKETGTLEFVAQSARILQVGKDYGSMNIVKNTRGPVGNTIHYAIDYGHQKMIETEHDEVFNNEQTKDKRSNSNDLGFGFEANDFVA